MRVALPHAIDVNSLLPDEGSPIKQEDAARANCDSVVITISDDVKAEEKYVKTECEDHFEPCDPTKGARLPSHPTVIYSEESVKKEEAQTSEHQRSPFLRTQPQATPMRVMMPRPSQSAVPRVRVLLPRSKPAPASSNFRPVLRDPLFEDEKEPTSSAPSRSFADSDQIKMEQDDSEPTSSSYAGGARVSTITPATRRVPRTVPLWRSVDDDAAVSAERQRMAAYRRMSEKQFVPYEERNEKNFLCTVCTLRFSTLNSLMRHKELHRETTYQCKYCDFVTKTEKDLNLHKLRRHQYLVPNCRPREFRCTNEDCDKSFFFKHELTRHLKSHSDARPYQCPLCPGAFRRREHLRSHIATHTDERPFACPHCEFRANQKSNLKTHLRVKHGE